MSATASVCRQGDWKWLAGAAPISGNGAAPPPQGKKLSFKTRGLDGLAGSKPHHRNGSFDWVAILSPIERQVKADGPRHPPRSSGSPGAIRCCVFAALEQTKTAPMLAAALKPLTSGDGCKMSPLAPRCFRAWRTTLWVWSPNGCLIERNLPGVALGTHPDADRTRDGTGSGWLLS